MAAIIDNTTDIKDYISTNENIDFKTLKPYIDNALIESITPWLGEGIIADVEANMSTVTAPYAEMIPMLQRSLTYFSILKALPFLEVNIGDEGVTRTETEHVKSAYRGQVTRIEDQLRADAYNALERLLGFLERNKVLYPLWTDAPGYVEFSNYLFKDSKEFSYFYALKNGRLTYNRLLSGMRYVTEFTIKGELGDDQYADFFLKKNSTSLTPEETIGLDLLKNAVANLTVAQSLIDGWVTLTDSGVHFTEHAEDTTKQTNADAVQLSAKIRAIEERGKSYLAKLVDYMNKNLDEFPIFRDDSNITKTNETTFTGAGGVKGFYGV